MLTFTLKKRWHDPDPDHLRPKFYIPPDCTQRRDRAVRAVCEWFNYTLDQFRSPSRWRGGKGMPLTTARFCLYWLLLNHIGMTQSQVARFMRRDRATVLAGAKMAAECPETMDIIIQLVDEMRTETAQ